MRAQATCQQPCPADIRSVWWPASDWNAGRHHVGTVAGFRLESVADFVGIHNNLLDSSVAHRRRVELTLDDQPLPIRLADDVRPLVPGLARTPCLPPGCSESFGTETLIIAR